MTIQVDGPYCDNGYGKIVHIKSEINDYSTIRTVCGKRIIGWTYGVVPGGKTVCRSCAATGQGQIEAFKGNTNVR